MPIIPKFKLTYVLVLVEVLVGFGVVVVLVDL
jgi:hypothetical protein